MSLRDELIQYSRDVINGKLLACQKHKWACERFLRDIEREGTEEFPYLFKEEKGERFLDWMRLFRHTKGALAGTYIEPVDLQKFVYGNVYGWVHMHTGLRRFKKVYNQRARKNAKSQELACVTSYGTFADNESMAEAYIGATKTEQSRIVWNEIKAQLAGAPELQGKYEIAYGKITHLKSGSIISALSKDAGKTGDGFSPSLAVLDEYHAHPDNSILTILTSGQAARTQPLTIIITTAGFNLSSPCYREEYVYASQLLDPDQDVENEEFFAMINELDKGDDIKDEKVWIKANPIVALTENGLNYLRSELKLALQVPEKMRSYMTKNMNVWMDAKEDGYMDMRKWREQAVEEPNDLRNYPVWVGLDLSTTTDLTSVGFVFKISQNHFIVKQHSFMPEDKLHERINSDRVPFDLWEKQGYLTTTPGSVVDYSYIEQHLLDMRDEGYQIQEIDYDKWNASYFAQQMEMQGFTMVEIPQMIRHLSLPTKDLRKGVFGKTVEHTNDPLLNWAMGNAIQKTDAQENIMIDKAKSKERIDPVAAVINAYSRATVVGGTGDLSSHFLNNWSL
jgi:phage terminase large subunit-like protein